MPEDVLGGDVGVAISSCIFLTGALQFGMRQSAEAENLMTSVERVMDYGDLKSEAYWPNNLKENGQCKSQFIVHVSFIVTCLIPNCPCYQISASFSTGVVEFQNVSLRYDENSNDILKNISFKTNANDKIGIVGRTGAGKSSLITALFRLSEPTGQILIDNVNIVNQGLYELRKNISIIPQG